MGAVMSCIQGIGDCIMTVINAIASVIMSIINGIVAVLAAIVRRLLRTPLKRHSYHKEKSCLETATRPPGGRVREVIKTWTGTEKERSRRGLRIG
ncbi:hypothetical protein VPNG_03601 [Cytospora leucostoma]|uniref:Uncharacterized protein n=1 Tax=Cytospora leucostoma TaxID=1230097 RepID=A0A423XCX8_9PEZI|nr:hypothetical protein VPNG_03601 [Cytospora leucostoma]